MINPTPSILSPAERLQKQLPKHCFWDEVEQELYIDARRFFPKIGVVKIQGWDRMMLDAEPIPDYPVDFKVMAWPKQAQFSDWIKQIPQWVQDSCALFPSHQMHLLHYAGKYPQILELLDHAPMLAWRLVKSQLIEPEILALLAGKRTQIAESVGWPGKAETVKFLTNLRLRWVDKHIAQQIEVCLLDEQRLSSMQDLPRINSMALSLAARFPQLIGSRLHHSLAKLPCRPMQCQSMVALLEDIYTLAEHQNKTSEEVAQIGESRYLVEVNQLYVKWLYEELQDKVNDSLLATMQATNSADKHGEMPKNNHDELIKNLSFSIAIEPTRLASKQQYCELSVLQQHAWYLDWQHESPKNQLFVWKDDDGIWAAELDNSIAITNSDNTAPNIAPVGIAKLRGLNNTLAGAKQLSTIHLYQAQLIQQQ